MWSVCVHRIQKKIWSGRQYWHRPIIHLISESLTKLIRRMSMLVFRIYFYEACLCNFFLEGLARLEIKRSYWNTWINTLLMYYNLTTLFEMQKLRRCSACRKSNRDNPGCQLASSRFSPILSVIEDDQLLCCYKSLDTCRSVSNWRLGIPMISCTRMFVSSQNWWQLWRTPEDGSKRCCYVCQL
jgi:hypothetical protein